MADKCVEKAGKMQLLMKFSFDCKAYFELDASLIHFHNKRARGKLRIYSSDFIDIE